MELRPLGPFAILQLSDRPDDARRWLTGIRGGLELPADPVSAYLRSGSIVLAIMEQTVDLVDRRFSVAGGSAIQTDGEYFWRMDTADYVDAYRVALPDEFLLRRLEVGWDRCVLTRQQMIDADRVIADFYREGLDENLWPDDGCDFLGDER
jgi:hypothetical protein